MNNGMTDYIILSVETPAFEDNIKIMVNNIVAAGGTSPTESIYYKDGPEIPNTNPIEYEQIPVLGLDPMIGTSASNGRIMFHFRLPQFFNEADLITFLDQGMNDPKPPVSVESIRSAYMILWIDDGLDPDGNPIGHYDYETTVQALHAHFLPYMPENIDSNGNPLGTINEHLSGYYGSDPILLS